MADVIFSYLWHVRIMTADVKRDVMKCVSSAHNQHHRLFVYYWATSVGPVPLTPASYHQFSRPITTEWLIACLSDGILHLLRVAHWDDALSMNELVCTWVQSEPQYNSSGIMLFGFARCHVAVFFRLTPARPGPTMVACVRSSSWHVLYTTPSKFVHCHGNISWTF